MSYDESMDESAGDSTGSEEGGDNNVDVQSQVDTFGSYTTGDFGNNISGGMGDDNLVGSQGKDAVTVGSQKGGQATKGAGNYAGETFQAPAPTDLSAAGQAALNQQFAAAASQQQNALAATPQDDDGFFGMFGGKTKAASDMANYGEFYQAGFAKDINTVENPTAARSNLPAEIAFDVAMNPFGRFSGSGEKAMATIQSVVPGGSLLGIARGLAYMSDAKPGKASGLGGDNEFRKPYKSGDRNLRTPRVTQGPGNKPTLNVPSRSLLRGYGRGTRRVG